jgi:hypothetical protein
VVQTSAESFTRWTVPADGSATQQSGVVAAQRLASFTAAVPAAHFSVRPSFEHVPPKSAQVGGLELEPLPLAPAPVVDDEHPAASTTRSTRP